MRTYTIKELENFTGIKAHTIRIWEQRFNLLVPERTDTGYRFYSDDDLKKILNINLLLKGGYKISKIAKLNLDEIVNQVNELQKKLINNDFQIEFTIQKLLEFGILFKEKEFLAVFEDYENKVGTEVLFQTIIYPLLFRVGLMWEKDEISPIQEHFISNLLRQRLLVAINNLPIVEKENFDAILFLPDTEFHEIGLIFANYLLKKNRYKTLYLGEQVPLNNLIYFIQNFNIKTSIGFIHVYPGNKKFKAIIEELSNKCANTTFYWSGNIEMLQKSKLITDLQIINSISDFNSKFPTL